MARLDPIHTVVLRMVDRRIALVTGCSDGGIGWHLADGKPLQPLNFDRTLTAHTALQQVGWRVFGTVRDLGKEGSLSNVRIIKMDVCDRQAVEAARDTIFSEVDRIDLLSTWTNGYQAWRVIC